MAQYSKANYISLYNTTFADNTSGNISEGDMRQFVQDTADSVGAGLFVANVTLSSAQILTLNSSPVTLIAAPGTGKIIEPVSYTFFLDYNSSAYTTNTSLNLKLSTWPLVSNTILSFSTDGYIMAGFSPSLTTVNIQNQPLTIDVSTGDPTAGDSPLYVYVTYRIITL